MTQTPFSDDKENIGTARAEVTVLRDRLARVQRQYDTLVQQKKFPDTAEQSRRLQQLMIENERLSHLIRETETVKNEHIENLVRANAELQNKLIKLETPAVGSVVTTPPTQALADNRIVSQRLFSPSVQKKLLDKYYRISKPPKEWTTIRDLILSNTDAGRTTILQILVESSLMDFSEECVECFRALVLALSKVTDPQLLVIRDRLADRLTEESVSTIRVTQIASLLSGLPTESFLDRKDIRSIFSIVCKTLISSHSAQIFKFVRRCIVHASAAEIGILQTFPSDSNIFITVSELLKPNKNTMLVTETLPDSQLRSEAVQIVVAGALKTRDLVALLNLRNDSPQACEKTLGERIFHLLLSELLRESRIRHFPIPDSLYTKFIPSRAEIIRGCWFCLTRLGAVWSDSGTPVCQSPVRECSLLVPSLIGLVKDLSEHRSSVSAPIDRIVCDNINDLIFLKELQDTVNGLETETSVWTV